MCYHYYLSLWFLSAILLKKTWAQAWTRETALALAVIFFSTFGPLIPGGKAEQQLQEDISQDYQADASFFNIEGIEMQIFEHTW